MNHSILQKALDKWGVRVQEDIAIEEMAELTKAIIKTRRGGNAQDVLQEIADAAIMIEQLKLAYGYTAVEDWIDVKMDRLKQRLTTTSE